MMFGVGRPGMFQIISACALIIILPAAAAAQMRSEVFVSGLRSPVAFVQDPTNRQVFFVVEQAGRIRTVRDRAIQSTDFLDLRSATFEGGERGLLGLAFAPDYATSGRVFVNFTNLNSDTVVARFKRSSNPLVADAGSRFDLRWGDSRRPVIGQPFPNHNGGHLAFGPDGYLYVGMGDGGSSNDPQNHAQRPDSLLGKMLRIDVNVPDDHPTGYRIPPDNPFLGGVPLAAQPEIWSFGLRNPWRYSFDDRALGGTGALVIADVGQGRREEIDHEPPNRGGRNYGWRNFEGLLPNVQTLAPAFQPLVDPIYDYDRNQGASVTGGYVYRGRMLGESFRGRYVFADYISGRVWSLALTVNASTGEATASGLIEHTAELGGAARLGHISSFGVDATGELFIVNHTDGLILRVLGPAAAPPTPTNPRIIR